MLCFKLFGGLKQLYILVYSVLIIEQVILMVTDGRQSPMVINEKIKSCSKVTLLFILFSCLKQFYITVYSKSFNSLTGNL